MLFNGGLGSDKGVSQALVMKTLPPLLAPQIVDPMRRTGDELLQVGRGHPSRGLPDDLNRVVDRPLLLPFPESFVCPPAASALLQRLSDRQDALGDVPCIA